MTGRGISLILDAVISQPAVATCLLEMVTHSSRSSERISGQLIESTGSMFAGAEDDATLLIIPIH
jgi:hypothetical protein